MFVCFLNTFYYLSVLQWSHLISSMTFWNQFDPLILKELFNRCTRGAFLSKWVRSALIFSADSHSLSEGDKKKEIPPPPPHHHPFFQIPAESHCYLHILLISKSESIIRDSAVEGARICVCIFIQLSRLSELIIRGDKLKRWGNNGSSWEAAERTPAHSWENQMQRL